MPAAIKLEFPLREVRLIQFDGCDLYVGDLLRVERITPPDEGMIVLDVVVLKPASRK